MPKYHTVGAYIKNEKDVLSQLREHRKKENT